MSRFCVLGSLNMDLVTRVTRFPFPGETLEGHSFKTFPGGKGANQTVALARLGAEVEFIGARGDDNLGDHYHALLKDLGVGIQGLDRIAGYATGTATILVDDRGENQIILVPGANAKAVPTLVERHSPLIRSAKLLLLQLEIPIDAVLAAARLSKEAGGMVILDPAPAQELPQALYRWIDLITPNETEASILTGVDTTDESGIRRAADILLSRGVGKVIIKAGARGAFLADADDFVRVPGFPVEVVDTVAAGDSFNAGLAYALGEKKALRDSIVFANAVAALATTREGAQSAMPSLEEVRDFLARRQ